MFVSVRSTTTTATTLALLAPASASGGAPGATAADVADFYRGRQLRGIGYEVGAGYDVYARAGGRFHPSICRASRAWYCRTCRGPAASGMINGSTTWRRGTAVRSADGAPCCSSAAQQKASGSTPRNSTGSATRSSTTRCLLSPGMRPAFSDAWRRPSGQGRADLRRHRNHHQSR